MKKTSILGAAALAVSVSTITSYHQVKAEDITNDSPMASVSSTTTAADEVSTKLEEAENNLNSAKYEQSSTQSVYDAAVQNKQEADNQVSELQEKVEEATNAQQIVAAQDEIISNSSATLNAAQSELDDTSTKLEKVVKAPENLVTELKSVEQTITNSQTELDQAKSDLAVIPQSVNDSNVAQVTNITDQMRSLKTQIDDTLTSISNNATIVDNGASGATTKTNLNDYEYNSNYRKADMEPVNYQGIRRVAEVISKKDYDEFVKTGVFKYKVDNVALSQAFIELLNELRQLNEIPGNIKLDEAFLKYAEARANEVASKNKLSHISTDSNVKALEPNDGLVENLNSGGSYKPIHSDVNGQHIINFDEIMTHKTLAYRVIQGWYSDFANINPGYGHRRALLSMSGDKLGLAINTITNDAGKESYYIAMEGQAYEKDDSTNRKEFWKLYNGFDDSDKLNPTILGKKMVFLPEYHFMFVVNGTDSSKVEKLNSLMAQKDALEKQLVDVVGSTLDLNVKSFDKAALSVKIKSLTEEIPNLKSRKAALQKEIDTVQSDYNSLTKNVAQLKEKIEVANTTLKDATAKKEEVLSLASHLDTLKAQLSEAIKSQQKANDTLVVVSRSLDKSKTKLDEAQKNYDAAKALYDLYQSYSVSTNDTVTIAVPKVAPTANSKPEYKLDNTSKETTKDDMKKDMQVTTKEAESTHSITTRVESSKSSNIEQLKAEDMKVSAAKYLNKLPETGTSNGILAMVIGQALTIVGLVALKLKRR